jgi:hypothetical protein
LSKICGKKVFSKRNIADFKDQLKIDLWEEVYLQSDVNRYYNVFLIKFCKFFLYFFPLKKAFSKKGKKSRWITQGIKVSRQRLQLLRLLKRKMSLSVHILKYVKTYQRIYRKVNSVARQRENDRIIERSDKNSKTLWKIIKKESGNSFTEIENISLKMDSMLVANPQDVSQQFNEFFVNSVDKF